MVIEQVTLQLTTAQLHLFLNSVGYCFEHSRDMQSHRGFSHVSMLTQVSTGWILDYAQERGAGDCDCKECEFAAIHFEFEELLTDADAVIAHGMGVKLQ